MSNELPATRTSLLKALEHDGQEQNLIALGIFYERYRHGLASLLTSRYGIDPQDANDILHDFLYEKMVDANLIRSYLDCVRQSPSGHRAFRPYLVRSLCNFTIDRVRRKKEWVVAPAAEEAVLASECSDLYTLQWAQDLLATTLQQTRSYYLRRDRERDWTLFVVRWIEPLVMGKTPPSYEKVAEDYGYESAKQVGNILTNVLRTFKQKWKAVLSADIGNHDRQAYTDALRDARLSVRMAKYIDFSQVLTQAMQKDVRELSPADLNGCRVDETAYQSILDLAMDGFDRLLPIEQSMIFESHLRTPLHLLLGAAFRPASDLFGIDEHLECVLADSKPSVERLQLLAKCFKKMIRNEDSPVPASILGVFRFAVIAIADLQCDSAITRVSRRELSEAMREALKQTWIDDRCRNLMDAYVRQHSNAPRVASL